MSPSDVHPLQAPTLVLGVIQRAGRAWDLETEDGLLWSMFYTKDNLMRRDEDSPGIAFPGGSHIYSKPKQRRKSKEARHCLRGYAVVCP